MMKRRKWWEKSGPQREKEAGEVPSPLQAMDTPPLLHPHATVISATATSAIAVAPLSIRSFLSSPPAPRQGRPSCFGRRPPLSPMLAAYFSSSTTLLSSPCLLFYLFFATHAHSNSLSSSITSLTHWLCALLYSFTSRACFMQGLH